MAVDDWAPVTPAPPAKGDDWADVSKPIAIGRGEEQAAADEALVAKERGYIPDEVKAFTRSAADTALIGAPTHAMALARSYSENVPYKEALAKERAYKEALERQSPKASMAGTGVGIAGSLLVPAGPIGAAGMKAAQLAGRAGLGATGKAAASGATIGAGFGGLSGVSEKYGTEEFTPEGIAKSAGIGALGGAALGPIAEKVLGKSVAPEHAARAAVLESQGVKPSQQMVTGIAAPEGAASKTAEEMTAKAKDVLAKRAETLAGEAPSDTAIAQSLIDKIAAERPLVRAEYKKLETMGEGATFSPETDQLFMRSITPELDKIKMPSTAFGLKDSPFTQTAAAMKFLENGIGSGNLPLTNAPRDVSNYEAVRQFLKGFQSDAKPGSADALGMKTIINGFDKAYTDALKHFLVKENDPEIGAKMLAQLEAARAKSADFNSRFKPLKGTGSKEFTNVINQMVDTSTGQLLSSATAPAGSAMAAQKILTGHLLSPTLGDSMYAKLESALGKGSPEMGMVVQQLKNKILSPEVNKDLSSLPGQINRYIANNPRLMQRIFDGQNGQPSIEDLKNLSKAIEIVNARPESDEAKRSIIGALVKKVVPTVAGAAIGYPYGALESVVGGLVGKGAGETSRGVSSIFQSRAQRAGAPKTVTPEGQGFNVPAAGRVFPVVKDLEEIPPPDREPNYRIPKPLARKSGGRVSDQLVRAVDRAKKNINKGTEVLLTTPDSHVAHALEVANRNLEG
jgi:hypothetical protein